MESFFDILSLGKDDGEIIHQYREGVPQFAPARYHKRVSIKSVDKTIVAPLLFGNTDILTDLTEVLSDKDGSLIKNQALNPNIRLQSVVLDILGMHHEFNVNRKDWRSDFVSDTVSAGTLVLKKSMSTELHVNAIFNTMRLEEQYRDKKIQVALDLQGRCYPHTAHLGIDCKLSLLNPQDLPQFMVSALGSGLHPVGYYLAAYAEPRNP